MMQQITFLQPAIQFPVTTLTGGGSGNGTATELLISEYIEGSSNNKAIEIANFTGAAVDLSSIFITKIY